MFRFGGIGLLVCVGFASLCVCFVCSAASAEEMSIEPLLQQQQQQTVTVNKTAEDTKKGVENVEKSMGVLDGKTDAQTEKLDDIQRNVNALRAASSDASSQTVTIDATQWDMIQKSDQLQNFFMLVLSLVTSSLLGAQLWASFSKGWRR